MTSKNRAATETPDTNRTVERNPVMDGKSSSERGTGRRIAAFVRHGHFARPEGTASAHSLFPLSPKGRGQARAAVDAILDFAEEFGLDVDARLEASQLLRAWETAKVIAEELESRTGRSFHVLQRNDLIERGIGSAANMRFEDIEALLAEDPRIAPLPKGWRRRPEFRLPVQGAESLMQAGARVAARVSASMNSIPADDSRDVMRLFVAHSGCLRHAAVTLGALDVRKVPGLSMGFAQTVLIEKMPNGEWVHLAGQFEKHLPGS